MKKYLLILSLCFSSFLFSQDLKKIDSLQNELAKVKNDSVKATIFNSLFLEYANSDIEKSKSYSDRLLDLAKTKQDDYLFYVAYYVRGIYHRNVSEYDDSSQSLRHALRYAEKLDNSLYIAKISDQLSRNYIYTNQNDSVLFYSKNAIEYFKKSDNHSGLAGALMVKANYYQRMQQLEESLKCFNSVDSIWSKLNIKNSSLATALNNTSLLLMEMGQLDKAEKYSLRSKKIGEEINRTDVVMKAEKALGYIDREREDYISAREKFQKVLNYSVSQKNKYQESIMLCELAAIGLKEGKYKEAETYLLKSIKISKEIGDLFQAGESMRGLAELYSEQKKYSESRKHLAEALEIFRNMHDIEGETECLKSLAEINFQTQNYKASVEYYQKYIPLKDSLIGQQNYQKVTELETQYQTAKKEQQIELLSAENELGKQRRKSQLTVFAAILGLLCIAGLALAFAYRNKIKTAEKIKELNAMKSRFFANISHEFRTPLTLIKSPLQTLQSELNDEKQQKQLSFIDKNSNRMLELVDQLLELSKIDSGKLKLILKEGNISSFLNSIAEPFEFRAKEKGQEFSSQIENQSENHFFDKDVIEKIVSNLLSNAEKYTPKGEKIEFHSNVENENLMITISNSGTNLKKQDLPKLFERFYQKSDQQQGFGIGLALIKELIDLYKGKIETSIENEVLSFQVSIPLKPNETENLVITKEEAQTIISQSPEANQDEELPVLLIADDNAEIRSVLKDLFEENYKIIEAENGKEALKQAQKEIPDCIISDVMMPEMDGFEFTKSLKENELTSFIPVILLTAKSSEEAHLKGLKTEADAFLTKPFHNEILKEKVSRLIAERKKLQERYSRELILKPVDIVINSVDEKFLEKLGEVMKRQLTNTGFSTDEFASEVGMSRMQLHRKLKTLLNVSATEFIRNERLKAAAELMKKGNKNVSEIAYNVGFNDVSYFSKSFKDLYHVTPSEFIHSCEKENPDTENL